MYVQQGNATGTIADFRYGSASPAAGTSALLIEHDAITTPGTVFAKVFNGTNDGSVAQLSLSGGGAQYRFWETLDTLFIDPISSSNRNVVVRNSGVGGVDFSVVGDIRTIDDGTVYTQNIRAINDGTFAQIDISGGSAQYRFLETGGTLFIDPISSANRNITVQNSGTGSIEFNVDGTASGSDPILAQDFVTLASLTDGSRNIDGLTLSYNGTDILEIISDSVATASGGFNYDVQALSGTVDTLNANNGLNSTITLSGNTSIRLENLQGGMTGNITVTNPATQYTLTLTNYTFIISPFLTSTGDAITMSGSSKKDVLSWYYDGTQVIINGTYDYQ